MRLDSWVASPARLSSNPDQHVQLGQGLIVHVHGAQRPGGVGDDERVPHVGLRVTGVEVGDTRVARPGR
jgi:hypothetical protein